VLGSLLPGISHASSRDQKALRPFPQVEKISGTGPAPGNANRPQLNAAIADYYAYWKSKYLIASTSIPGAWKVNYDRKGGTVSEAMGYGMMITAYMAGQDPAAKNLFDGLNAFRKHFPSKINPAFMCWKIPAKESPRRDDSAADGDLDIAFALLLAHAQWGEAAYLEEARVLIGAIGRSLVRPDFSIRLGDWNDADGQTRPSDFMPLHFRAFQKATGDALWNKVEEKSYSILSQLQARNARDTGLFPDFAILEGGNWKPTKAGFLEGPHDGEFNYNACRVPWRLGWAAERLDDERAKRILSPFMEWMVQRVGSPPLLVDGYRLDGSPVKGGDPGSACFISPTGVAAMVTGKQTWLDKTCAFALTSKDLYYQDSVNLLCLLVMSGNAWMP